jgi:hypothetical protein
MKASKINSKATYHKCMKELEALGFMEYMPTFNPHSCSNVIMVNFSGELKKRPKFEPLTSSKNKPVQNLTHSKSEQVVEQVNDINNLKNNNLSSNNNQKQDVEPVQKTTRLKNEQHIEQVNEQVYIYNNKTYTNNINKDIYGNSEILNFKNINAASVEIQEKEEKKNCAKKEEANKNGITPSIEMILEYFAFKESSETEANKFFNYYSSIGWLVGGKTKMKDWKASARNWIMNQNKFQPKSNRHPELGEGLKPNHLQTSNYKNYAEPL